MKQVKEKRKEKNWAYNGLIARYDKMAKNLLNNNNKMPNRQITSLIIVNNTGYWDK